MMEEECLGPIPTEEVVQALLDHFVEPLLPSSTGKSKAGEPPSSQHHLVAKQMHAVVVLYNYYMRRRNPELKRLGFKAFCKLAVVLKPAVLVYMKLMLRSDLLQVDDLESQLSLTEKAVMDACDICMALEDAAALTEGWPVRKVAVMLVCSRKERCFLRYSDVTSGVRSVIEKDVIPDLRKGDAIEGKRILKRKRIVKKCPRGDQIVDEDALQELAFLAVKEATGINKDDVVILERHSVYSLSKEKSVVKFYIMQCIPSLDKDLLVSVKDVVESLQSPLLKKNSGTWTVTPAIEYFQLLPSAQILLDWFSREGISYRLQDPKIEVEDNILKNSPGAESCCGKGVVGEVDKNNKRFCIPDSVTDNSESGMIKFIDKRDSCCAQKIYLSDGVEVDMDGKALETPLHEGKSLFCQSMTKVYHRKKRTMTGSSDSVIHGSTDSILKDKEEMVESMIKSSVAGSENEKFDTDNKECGNASCSPNVVPGDIVEVPFESNSPQANTLQSILISKKDLILETGLRVLLMKKERLSHELRTVKSEIELCEQRMKTILNGGKDDFALTIDAIVEGCNDVCLNSNEVHVQTNHGSENQQLRHTGGKRLAEADFSSRSPCQELDNICHVNDWMLPRYSVLPSDGGFIADVNLIGGDFECTIRGDVQQNPHEARQSAAAGMIAKLRSLIAASRVPNEMAAQSNAE